MKSVIRYYFILLSVVFCCYSCNNDDSDIVVPEEETEIRYTSDSSVMIVNTKDIEIGNNEDDFIYVKHSEILVSGGKTYENTLDCYGMCAAFTDADSIVTSKAVENVTLINRGKITVHTKYLFDKYKDKIQTIEDPNRPYKYLRFVVMYGGRHCKVINEGVIDVYFDHDPTTTSTIYTIAMSAESGSTLINDGDINFHGTGSLCTRMRSMASFADNLMNINNGNMTVDIDMAADIRMITSGGTYCNVINNKFMSVKAPGVIECMTRFGDSNIINNGTIELTSKDIPDEYAEAASKYGPINDVSALYEGLGSTRTTMPSMVNKGTIKLINAAVKTRSSLVGMLYDMVSTDVCRDIQLNIVNDGEINFGGSQTSLNNMAEASFIIKSNTPTANSYSTVKMGKWNTTLRNFGENPYLFIAKGIKMDFTGGELVLKKTSDNIIGSPYSVAYKDLLINWNSNFIYEVKGYDNLSFKSSEKNYAIDWNKENQTVSFQNK